MSSLLSVVMLSCLKCFIYSASLISDLISRHAGAGSHLRILHSGGSHRGDYRGCSSRLQLRRSVDHHHAVVKEPRTCTRVHTACIGEYHEVFLRFSSLLSLIPHTVTALTNTHLLPPSRTPTSSVTVVADVFSDWSKRVLPPCSTELYIGHRGFVSSVVLTNVEGTAYT